MTTLVNDCPTAAALKAYASGALDRSAHAVIAGHLDSCVTCQGELETLDELPGTLFYGLRGQRPAPAAADPLLLELQARAIDLAGVAAPAPSCAAQSGPPIAEEIAALTARLGADGADLARDLVAQGAVTSYQAQEIHAGRADGLVLGHYLLQRPIGAGGMGRVFQAYHRRMKRVVALKIMAPELLRSSAARARFQREIEAVARLRSPYIVTAYDAGEDQGRDYLVMEYAAGPTLAELVKQQGPLPVERALTCVLQAARGLACAHEAGIIHRDVKPANLLLTNDGDAAGEVVKVLDLGLARLQAPADAPGGSDLTGSQVVAGTAAFMAPEQALQSGQADARADVYSLGCTLHYLLVGKPPYPGETAMAILFAHREQPIPSLAALRPDCPAAVDALFQHMLAKRKEDRPDLPAVIAGLEALLGAAPRKEGGQAKQAAAAPRRRRLLAGLLSAAGVLAASLLIAWMVQRNGVPGGNPATEAAAPTRSVSAPAIDLVQIPAGDFWMGAADDDADASGDEKPRHRVAITLPAVTGVGVAPISGAWAG